MVFNLYNRVKLQLKSSQIDARLSSQLGDLFKKVIEVSKIAEFDPKTRKINLNNVRI